MVKDALGTFVSHDYLYLDAAGHIWQLETETARVIPNFRELAQVFASTDCSGASHVSAVSPRYVFTLAGDVTTYRVRGDTQLSETIRVRSSKGTSGCSAANYDLLVIPTASTAPGTPIQAPDLGLTPPLRIERP